MTAGPSTAEHCAPGELASERKNQDFFFFLAVKCFLFVFAALPYLFPLAPAKPLRTVTQMAG